MSVVLEIPFGLLEVLVVVGHLLEAVQVDWDVMYSNLYAELLNNGDLGGLFEPKMVFYVF